VWAMDQYLRQHKILAIATVVWVRLYLTCVSGVESFDLM